MNTFVNILSTAYLFFMEIPSVMRYAILTAVLFLLWDKGVIQVVIRIFRAMFL